MSFNGSFTISQGVDPTTFSLTDTSTGTDSNLTDRRIFLYLFDGSTLIPPNSSTPYIDWPLSAGSSITLTGILQIDYSINIQVEWISSSPLPSPSTYIYSLLQTFTANLELFNYGLSQMQAGNPLLISDNHYFFNKAKFRVLLEDAKNATTYNDQKTAQLSLNAAYNLQLNQKTYF